MSSTDNFPQMSEAVKTKLRWLGVPPSLSGTRKEIAEKFNELGRELAQTCTPSDQLFIALQRLIDARESAIRAAIITEESSSNNKRGNQNGA